MLPIGGGCICGGKLGFVCVIVHWAVDNGKFHHDISNVGYVEFELQCY